MITSEAKLITILFEVDTTSGSVPIQENAAKFHGKVPTKIPCEGVDKEHPLHIPS